MKAPKLKTTLVCTTVLTGLIVGAVPAQAQRGPFNFSLSPNANINAQENATPGRGTLPPTASETAGENSIFPSAESPETDESEDQSDGDESSEDDDDDDVERLILSGLNASATDGETVRLTIANRDDAGLQGPVTLTARSPIDGSELASWTSESISTNGSITVGAEEVFSGLGSGDFLLEVSSTFDGVLQARRFTDAIGYSGLQSTCGENLRTGLGAIPSAPSSGNMELITQYRVVNTTSVSGAGIIRLYDEATGALEAEFPVEVPASSSFSTNMATIEFEGTLMIAEDNLASAYTLIADLPEGWQLDATYADSFTGVGFDSSFVCAFEAEVDDGSETEGESDGDASDVGETDPPEADEPDATESDDIEDDDDDDEDSGEENASESTTVSEG